MEDMARLAVVEQTVRNVDKFNKVLYELLQHINSILDNPHDYNARTIKSAVLKDVLQYKPFQDYLLYIGFRCEGPFVFYPKELTLSNLRMAQAAIERKICFCFGALNIRASLKSNSKSVELKPVKILTTNNELLLKIERLFNEVLIYENEELLELARAQIPVVSIELMALDRVREDQKLIKTGKKQAPDMPFHMALLMELMGWFKYKFFTWVDTPECEGCARPTTFQNTKTIATEKEICKTEVYSCKACGLGAKFVRYNDPRMLLKTRRGRCGEWANCFMLFCRALGYETRFVYDTTDHVWCEIFDYDTNAWIHVDPCEGKLNSPLMYEHGWGKKLSYVIAVSREELQDVTWRYTMNHKELLKRRTACSEQELVDVLMQLRARRQEQVSEARRWYLAKRTVQELISLMVERKPTHYETHGRISGSAQWRTSRGEIGRQKPGYTFMCERTGDYVMRYYSADDYYQTLQDNAAQEKISTWAAGVYQANDIFRKVEHDWKKAYLAREEDKTEGYVAWRVCAGTGLRLTQLRVRMAAAQYSSGKLLWTVQYDEMEPEPIAFKNDTLLREMKLEQSCQSVVLRVELSGGDGDVAWQHAQVCRQQLDATTPALEISAHVVQRK